MPSEPLIDPKDYLNKAILYDRKTIETFVPHRFEFALLDGVYHVDPEKKLAVGFNDAKLDSFWVRGHIPGRAIMPGVLMIEAAAQLCTFHYQHDFAKGEKFFMGFGGVDKIRFRSSVEPGSRLLLAVRCDRLRSNASTWTVQGFVGEKPIFDGQIFALAL